MMKATINITKHYKGCYRTNSIDGKFGQIKKDGREWKAEIRNSNNGEIERYAGIWNTKKEAVEESVRLLTR